jgi:hypothetical protein
MMNEYGDGLKQIVVLNVCLDTMNRLIDLVQTLKLKQLLILVLLYETIKNM